MVNLGWCMDGKSWMVHGWNLYRSWMEHNHTNNSGPLGFILGP